MFKLDSVRNVRRLLPLCILFIVLNLIYLATHSTNVLTVGITGSSLYKKYYSDADSKFMVLQPVKNENSAYIERLKTATINGIDNEFDYYHVDLLDKSELPSYEEYTIVYADEYDLANVTSFDQRDSNDELNDLVKVQYYSKFKATFITFLTHLLDTIEDCRPSVPPINNDDHYRLAREENNFPNKDGRVPVYGGHLRENYLSEPVRTEKMLANYLRLDDDELTSLVGSHNKFMSGMMESYPEDLFRFSEYNLFMKGDGIVYLGGDEYNQLALLSIKMLRSTGSKLPIELIIPKESDYDIEVCNNILPNLNAKCKVMSDYLPSRLMEKVKGYQLKNLALLISSFKNVLYLDADNIPLKNPDHLFSNDPFLSNHLVLWPDLWRRSTSPNFYKIIDVETSPEERVRNSYFKDDPRGESKEEISFHDTKGTIPEASSETGQILINKEVHIKTLILSMYYNYFGPQYYYPLLSQGQAGEGDKETFIAAAHKLGLPYYQVNEFVREFGPMDPNNKHHFFAMGQYDPLVDFAQQSHFDACYNDELAPDYADSAGDKLHSNYNFHYFKSSSLMFLHANWPKFKLHDMFIGNSNGRGPKTGDKRRRLYHTNIMEETSGSDVELLITQSLQWLYCELDINIKKVPDLGSDDRNRICEQIGEQVKFLLSKQA